MSGHVAPKTMYYAVFTALIVGTGLTVLVAFFDLGVFNNILMLSIACAKALLVILFFMCRRCCGRAPRISRACLAGWMGGRWFGATGLLLAPPSPLPRKRRSNPRHSASASTLSISATRSEAFPAASR